MKKNRLIPFLLLFSLLVSTLLPISALAVDSGSAIVDEMHIEAEAALLMDANNGEVLYAQNAYERHYPASITKVMAALLAIEAVDRGELSLDQVITVGPEYDRDLMEGGSTQDIKEGEQLTLRDVLYCALIPSANEACNVLAQAVSGSVDTFVALMNQRAAELGMKDTHFANTHGLHNDNHYTTAYDIYLMAQAAMSHKVFREIVSSKSYTVPATNLHAERVLHDTNALVSTFRLRGYYYEYATGIKTGSTPEAGYCLCSSATKDGRDLIAVVLGAKNVKRPDGATDHQYFSESKRLLEWGFNNFSRRTIIDSTVPLREVEVTLSKDANYVTVHPDGKLEATLPNDLDVAGFERRITCPETIEAPVQEGQVLGKVTLSYNGQDYGTLDLVATSTVTRSELLYRLDRISKFLDQFWVKAALVVLGVGILALILRHLIFGKRKKYSGSRGYGGGYGSRRRRR